MSQSTVDVDVSGLVSDLESAATAAARAQDRVSERGEATLERIARYYGDLQDLFEEYEEGATGDGDFRTFIEFQEEMDAFIDRLPEDLPYRERFEAVDELMQQRRLTESDFAEARAELSPVADDVARLEERDATASRYRDLREQAQRRVRELGEHIRDLESLRELGAADLEAPVDHLREPIAAYDDAVGDAFQTFKRDERAERVLEFVAGTSAYPLVPFEEPPADLLEYVRTNEAGTEPIPQLLEYDDFSDSKLDHYVDSPRQLKQHVGTHRTYLRRLDADPLTVGWPPPTAAQLSFRTDELVSVVGKFAPAAVVERLRSLRELTDREDYERLRKSATAREQVTDEQRERLASGAVDDDIEAAREARGELEAALDSLPAA
jgi:hypothetical protein